MMHIRQEPGEAWIQKESWRRKAHPELPESEKQEIALHWGKIAASVRRSIAYRKARHLMVPPSSHFFQVRLNALMDRKLLTVPTPGMQNGFRHFDPDRIPAKDRLAAARLRMTGAALTRGSYGSMIPRPVDLLVGEAFCGCESGALIGDGRGHLDLTCAVLAALGWLDRQAQILAVVLQYVAVSTCPQEEHDVKAHWLITRQGVIRTKLDDAPKPAICWEKLSLRQIRRNEILFYLASRDNRIFA